MRWLRLIACTTLAILVLAVSSLQAKIFIAVENRIANERPGYCAWCSIGMLARHHKISSLVDVVAIRKEMKRDWVYWEGSWYEVDSAGGYEETIARQLIASQVPFRMQSFNNLDDNILWDATRKNLGCVVGLINYPSPGALHAVVLTDYNQHFVEFVDPNDISAAWRASRQWFDEHWVGYTIVIEPRAR